jgi:hypothetical protein
MAVEAAGGSQAKAAGENAAMLLRRRDAFP